MTLRDQRIDGDGFTGIALECPVCDGVLPVEKYIEEEQCPMCDSILDVEVTVLHQGDPDADPFITELGALLFGNNE